jgi:hypothetical protein
MAPMLFQATMAYAAENQIDGNFEGYSPQLWAEVFSSNNIPVTPSEAALIKKEFQRTGLLDGDKIRSWSKFNREFAHYETLTKYRQRAGKLSAKKREIEARAAVKNGHVEPSKAEKIPSKTAPKADEQEAIRKELWTNKELLQSATGKQKRALIAQREQLIARVTGVDITPPSSPAPPPPVKPRKVTAADREREALVIAQSMLKDYPPGLNIEHVRVLVAAGIELPAEVQARFSRLFKNPVPE